MVRVFLAVLFWVSAAACAVADVFDPSTNILTIPNLQIGSETYQNSSVLLSPSGQWRVLRVGNTTADTSTSSSTSSTTSSTTTPALQINPTKFTATVGSDVTVVASGGTPPYTFTSSSSNMALVSRTGSQATFLVYGIGDTSIIVTDSAGNLATATPTMNSLMAVGPDKQTAVVGEQVTVTFVNGVPPYTVGTSNSTIAKAGEVTMHAGSRGTVTIYTFRPGPVTIMVHDSLGQMQYSALTVTATR
ncbi:MAG: hypothetical protein KGZ83_09405 [Sulfuricella sp.]|nr:hypothetical protein [Sulfuricella sp.]